MKLILATRNPGKVKELTAMLNAEKQQKKIQILTLQDYPKAPEVIEDCDTYQLNAAKKATVIADYTGVRTLADDAGLEVDALGGEPGIHSKRWAGDDATDADRVKKLLQELEGVTNRTARFIAAMAVADPINVHTNDSNDNSTQMSNTESIHRVQIVVGKCEGYISCAPAGDSGFGYDPIFVPIGYEKSFAELGDEIKNKISHLMH